MDSSNETTFLDFELKGGASFQSFYRSLRRRVSSWPRFFSEDTEPSSVFFGESIEKSSFWKENFFNWRPLRISKSSMLEHEVILGSSGSWQGSIIHSRIHNLNQSSPNTGIFYFDASGDATVSQLNLRLLDKIGFKGERHIIDFDSARKRKENHFTFNPLRGLDAFGITRWLSMSFIGFIPERSRDLASSYFLSLGKAHSVLKNEADGDPGIVGLLPLLKEDAALQDNMRLRRLHSSEEALRELHQLRDSRPSEISEISDIVSGVISEWRTSYSGIFETSLSSSGIYLEPNIDFASVRRGDYVQVSLPSLEFCDTSALSLAKALFASFQLTVESFPESDDLLAYAYFDEFGYYAPISSSFFPEMIGSHGVGLVVSAKNMTSLTFNDPSMFDVFLGFKMKTILNQEDLSPLNRKFISMSFDSAPSYLEIKGQRQGYAWVSYPDFSGRISLAYANI